MTQISPQIDKVVQIISKDKVVVRSPGIAGPKGDPGSSLLTGEGNPSNSVGKVGDVYIDVTDKRIYGPKDVSGWDLNQYTAFAGSSFFSGVGFPQSSLGNTGDSYLDTNTLILYVKQNGVWGSGIELVPVTNYSFTYEKQLPSSTWDIVHNLGFNPNVMVMDYSENNIECDLEYVNENELTLTFIQAGSPVNVSGYAYLS
jgi:hypothetical protein